MHSSRNPNRNCGRGAIPENEQIHLPYPKAVGNGDEENRESRFLKGTIFFTRGGFGNGSLRRHQRLHFLLSLSKKSERPIPIILAPLKINNLQATENRKMLRIKVFRQPRYLSSISKSIGEVSISFPFIEPGNPIFLNLDSLPHLRTRGVRFGRGV